MTNQSEMNVAICRLRQVLTATAAGLILAACTQEAPPEPEIIRPVRAVQVNEASEIAGRYFPGRAKATREVDLAFRVSGPLVERPVFVGDAVQAGELVAQIDPTDFEVEVEEAGGSLDRAQANLDRAEGDLRRVSNIREKDPGAMSEAAVDEARDNRDSARADVRALRARLQAAENNLRYTELRAPFSGTVVATYVENFENVEAKQRIVRILDTSRIEFVTNLPESIIAFAPYARGITVEFDAYPGLELPATIKEIGTEASQTTRTYPINLIMDQPEDLKILPGMAGKSSAASVDVPEDQREKGFRVPVTAVFSKGDTNESFVWIIDENNQTVTKREVKTARLTDAGILVTQGLEAGEWIAVAGVNYLREGQQIKIQIDGEGNS